RFQNPYFDGAASITIGLILTGVSLVLTRESRSLLMGETASPHLLQEVIKIAEAHPAILKVQQHLSTVLGPEEVLLILKVGFQNELSAAGIVSASEEIKYSIQKQYPAVKQIFIEPD
ncbi:MAG: cation transporter, partial [Bacteroidota bacterium]|nr:cation transporter [Bacteroidota bacterium]